MKARHEFDSEDAYIEYLRAYYTAIALPAVIAKGEVEGGWMNDENIGAQAELIGGWAAIQVGESRQDLGSPGATPKEGGDNEQTD